MNTYLSNITERVDIDTQLVERAFEIGIESGVSGADAIHAAAAEKLGAEEFITKENADKPLYGLERAEQG